MGYTHSENVVTKSAEKEFQEKGGTRWQGNEKTKAVQGLSNTQQVLSAVTNTEAWWKRQSYVYQKRQTDFQKVIQHFAGWVFRTHDRPCQRRYIYSRTVINDNEKIIERLQDRYYRLSEAYDRLYERYEQLKEYCKSFLKAMELFPEKVKAFLKKLLEKQEKTKAPKTKNRAEKETARGMTGYKKWKLRLIKRSLAFIRWNKEEKQHLQENAMHWKHWFLQVLLVYRLKRLKSITRRQPYRTELYQNLYSTWFTLSSWNCRVYRL